MLSLLYCLSGHRESESTPCSPSFIVCQDTGRVSPHRAFAHRLVANSVNNFVPEVHRSVNISVVLL